MGETATPTLSALIRQHPDKQSLVVAEIVGVSTKHVIAVRWNDANKDRHKESARNSQRRRRGAPAPPRMHPSEYTKPRRDVSDEQIIAAWQKSRSPLGVAHEFGVTLGQVNGVLFRHRKAQEARS